MSLLYFCNITTTTITTKIRIKQAGAELGQTQVKVEVIGEVIVKVRS